MASPMPRRMMRTDANCGNRLAARRRTAHRLATQRLTVRRLMGRRRPAAASPRIQQWITDRSQACDLRRRTAITTICPKRIGRRVKMVRRKFLPYLRPQPPTLRRSPPAESGWPYRPYQRRGFGCDRKRNGGRAVHYPKQRSARRRCRNWQSCGWHSCADGAAGNFGSPEPWRRRR